MNPQHFLRRGRRLSLGEYSGSPLVITPTDWWLGNGNFSNSATNTNPLVNYTTVGFTVGVNSNAFIFNGSSYAYATNAYIMGPFTVMGWFNTTSGIGGSLFSTQQAQTSTSGIRGNPIYIQDNGKVGFAFYSGGPQLAVSSNAYNDGKWHHVVVTLTNAASLVYIDGVLVATNTTTGGISNISTYTWWDRIGNGDFGAVWGIPMSSAYYTGLIQDFRVYNNITMTNTQINLIYALGPS